MSKRKLKTVADPDFKGPSVSSNQPNDRQRRNLPRMDRSLFEHDDTLMDDAIDYALPLPKRSKECKSESRGVSDSPIELSDDEENKFAQEVHDRHCQQLRMEHSKERQTSDARIKELEALLSAEKAERNVSDQLLTKNNRQFWQKTRNYSHSKTSQLLSNWNFLLQDNL